MTLNNLKKELNNLKNPKQAKLLQGFFKTKKGEYGEGDIFLGIKVPIQRQVAKKYDLTLNQLQELLNTNIHEFRLCAIFILLKKYETNKKEIYNFYLKNTKRINNWDLVDLSAHKIIGDYIIDKDRSILYTLANSNNLWEKRISIISTFAFIKDNDFKDALKIAEILLNDKHDLIHKAVGWVLREIGKKNQEVEEEFLIKYHKTMPRTMLRYSLEKFNEEKRKFYMKK